MKPLLILKMGQTLAEISEARGDFEDWIQEGMGWTDDVQVIRPFLSETLPEGFDYAGVVITGSAAMVSDKLEWSQRVREWIQPLFDSDVPILGICYGHQFLADALGGRVGRNPLGTEVGTVEICLARGAMGDPLFSGMGESIVSQAYHSETVLELPKGAVRLAYNERDPNQAFRMNEHIWGTQFHPEFDADVSRRYATARREKLRAEEIDPDGVLAGLNDSFDGNILLQRFGALVVNRSRS